MPPDARLDDVRRLQALRPSAARLDLTPRHVLQQDRPWPLAARLRRAAGWLAVAALIHIGFAVALVFLLTTHDIAPSREIAIPVEMVTALPETAKPPSPASPPRGANALQQAMAAPVAPDPKQPAPPQVQPVTPPPETSRRETSQPVTPPVQEGRDAPKLVAPPPEPTRAATQDRDAKPANLAPDKAEADAATHESRPAEVPRTLSTTDDRAAFAVPVPLPPKPDPLPKPAPPVPAKVPSAADKLAAALPMDTSAMPMSFRNVLAGNGAQVSAAYKGLVYGRFNRNAAVSEQARRQHLKGQVIVAFTIDDAGQIASLTVVQSSGNAALDALGLEMIRSAAPFPPPPPEAQRSFTPALSFGP